MNTVIEEVAELSRVTELAFSLTPDEQAVLLFRLEKNLSSIKPDPEAEQAWSVEIERRVRQIESGEVELIDGDAVMREARERLSR